MQISIQLYRYCSDGVIMSAYQIIDDPDDERTAGARGDFLSVLQILLKQTNYKDNEFYWVPYQLTLLQDHKANI